MLRRHILMAGAGAGISATLLASGASAQVDAGKLPILMGGDFAAMTSKLALTRAQNPAVRGFAQLEIAEQVAVAHAFGSMPGAAGISAEDAALYQQLQGLSGPEFDAMYIQGQVLGHRKLLGLHKAYASTGSDAMARGASIVAVPSIETHLGILATMQRT